MSEGIKLQTGDYRQFYKHISMSDAMAMSVSDGIPSFRYTKAINHITLLRSMQEIDNAEVKRLISLLKSPDSENWHIAESVIDEKLG